MEYRVEFYDPEGRHVASFNRVPLLEAVRTSPDEADRIEGLLPTPVEGLGPGYRVRISLAGCLFLEAPVTRVLPRWGESRKLVLDRYVALRNIVAFEAATVPFAGNTTAAGAWTHATVDTIIRELIQRAPGPIHYTVDHAQYPDGAQREFAKFMARQQVVAPLPSGSIASGQWAGASRIDTATAFARDGQTIAGLVVDGALWPDLRLMMVDVESMTRDAEAIARHPEVADWTDARYAASQYGRQAELARAALQFLLDNQGIDYIELNPHRDAMGAYDGRIDASGRYIGLVYGGGECFNAALVEQGLADVCLHDEGRTLDPLMQLKDFFSYATPCRESIRLDGPQLESFDFSGGVLEALTLLAYAARGSWSIDQTLAVTLRAVERPDHVVTHIPQRIDVGFGASSLPLVNVLEVEGHPLTASIPVTRRHLSSIATYGEIRRRLTTFALSREADVTVLAEGLLDDLAYPEIVGEITFHEGAADHAIGDLVEVRGERVKRLHRRLPEEWGGRFDGRAMGRIKQITHRFSGRDVTTRLSLTSPLRAVANPLHAIVRSQPPASTLYQLRLDDATTALDTGYTLV